MNGVVSQALFFLQRSRFQEAEDLLRKELVANPQNAYAHSVLALALLAQARSEPALIEARAAISIKPDFGYAHTVYANILRRLGRIDTAMSAIREAIRLEPENPRNYEELTRLHMVKRDWSAALKSADQGLRLDPQDIDCLNLRAMILVQTGRKVEANEAIETALKRDPENATTHATRGWSLLHRGDPHKAMEHFREALRLRPNLEWARDGIVESMKARNPLYRLLLGYFLWMSRLDNRARVGVIFGGYFGLQVVRQVSNSNPELRPLLIPVIGLYFIFVFLTWAGPSLFDLILRLDRFGRLALSREEIVASNWVGGCVLLAIILAVIGLAGGETIRTPVLIAAAQSLAMVIPVAGVFKFDPGKNRQILTIYTAVLALLVVIGLLQGLSGNSDAEAYTVLFVLGWIVYTWVANILAVRRR